MSPLRLSLLAFFTLISGTVLAGDLKVNLAPSQAVSAGARWRVDGGTWRTSGTTVKNLTNAAHTVDYKTVSGWISPGPVTVTLTNNVTTTVTGTYVLPASLVVTLSPSTGQWRVDGGAWRNSGTTATGLTPGAHTVSYNALANQIAPATESVTLVSGQTTSLTRNYTATSNLTVTLTPSNASWQIDGGPWQPSGSTLSGLTPGAHTISYNAIPNHITPATESVTLVSGQTTSLARTYTETSNLTINLSPSNGSWRVDGGAWQSSGATLSLTLGAHMISYSALANYIAPPNETVTLISGQSANFTRGYTATSNLTVNLTPSNASWQIDGGPWQPSGTTLTELTPGSHSISYSALANHITPAAESVTLVSGESTNVSRSYTATSNLTVNLTPSNASWQIDGGPWQPSGTTLTELTPGSHSISYSALANHITPAAESVALVSGETTSLTRTYTETSDLTVNLTPSNATWRVDGGAWQPSGATLPGLTLGAHTISYSALANYIAPSTETVTLVSGPGTNLTRTYTATSNLTVNLTPSSGSWKIDDGAWQPSGTTLTELTPGPHSISYSALANHIAPATESLTLVSGESTNVSRSYTETSDLTVNLTPSNATWRVDGGAWQPSGATLPGLTLGAHTINYSALANYIAPSTETVTLVSGPGTNLTRTYTATSNLTVTLTPSSGSWRIDGGAWHPSGATVAELTPGEHTISFNAVANYITPAPETVTLISGQTTDLTRSYTATSNLKITLTPSSGWWQIDGAGAWRTSGTTVTGLTPGNHTIAYSNVNNMLPPPAETVALVSGETTSLDRAYTPAGQVFVMLNPNTAQWRVDGGAWRATHTYSGLIAAGSHTIEYSSLPEMLTPAPQTVSLTQGQTLAIAKTYVRESALIVNLSPASMGQWRVDGGPWQESGARVAQLTHGNHAVEYTAAPEGYTAPPSETVFLSMETDTTIARSYLRPGSVTVNVVPAEGQWRLNNGPWQASGATLSGLRPGNYTVHLASVPGWFDVPAYGITLAEDEAKTVSYAHVRHATITVTLAPGTAQWRVDGGAWQPSGATLGALFSGNHMVDYSPVAGMTTPPSETFALSAGQQKSLSRSYGGAPSLTVNLSLAGGQWRVDGGAWQPSGSVMFNVALGSHIIEYAPLAGYIAPPTETVWFRQNQSLNLSRSYLDSAAAYLDVKAVPSYLAETGVARWRVDGGDWNTAGAPVAMSPGTHTLEFQPVTGLEVPPASSVTVNAGAVETVEATFYMTHRLRFFLHPDLVAGLSNEDLQARLSQYAAHLQTIWHRESLRRFTFNPATDISIVSATPFSGNAYPPLPEYGFELWAHADSSNGSIYGSHGGFAGLDVSGAGGADGMHWTQIYDPSTLAPGSPELYEYWKQIDAIIHEFEHVFGGGLGEYYSFTGFDDFTGVAPFYSVDYFAPADPFWNGRADYWGDPLLRSVWGNYRIGNPTALPALLDAVRFSATSRGIIDGCNRNADSGHGTRTALPDLSRIQISAVDANSGQPIPGATLRIWNRPNPGPMGGQERTVVATSTPGVFEFNWTADSSFTPLNSWDNGKLLKAFASGYQPKAQWEWIYDAQRVKTVDNADVWEITVALDPAP